MKTPEPHEYIEQEFKRLQKEQQKERSLFTVYIISMIIFLVCLFQVVYSIVK